MHVRPLTVQFNDDARPQARPHLAAQGDDQALDVGETDTKAKDKGA